MDRHRGQQAFFVKAGLRRPHHNAAAVKTAEHRRGEPDLFKAFGDAVDRHAAAAGPVLAHQAFKGDELVGLLLSFGLQDLLHLAGIAVQPDAHGVDKTVAFPVHFHGRQLLHIGVDRERRAVVRKLEVVDKVVAVTAPREVRIERVMQRDGISYERASEWVDKQMLQENVESRADYVIVNDGRQSLDSQVATVLKQIEKDNIN